MRIVSVAGAVALLSATMFVAPDAASAGVHAPVIYRAGRLLCYYPFGWRGPGYYPCRRPHFARPTRAPHVAAARVRVREPRAGRVAEVRRLRLRQRHAHDGGHGSGGGHGPGDGHGHGGGHGGGHHMGGGRGSDGGRMIVHRQGGRSFGEAPLRGGRIDPAPVGGRYGHAGYSGGGSFRAYPTAAPLHAAPLHSAPMRSAPMGGGMRIGTPIGGGMHMGAPAGGGMHMGAPAGGGMHMSAPAAAPMAAPMGGGMHTGAPMAAPAPAMHMPAAPAMPAPAAPAPAIHPPAPAPAPAAHH